MIHYQMCVILFIFQMFTGNSNGNFIKTNTLKYPVIARYIRFHPVRWNMVISMRVEAHGCAYSKLFHEIEVLCGTLNEQLNMI